jgi:hypothetical protein
MNPSNSTPDATGADRFDDRCAERACARLPSVAGACRQRMRTDEDG